MSWGSVQLNALVSETLVFLADISEHNKTADAFLAGGRQRVIWQFPAQSKNCAGQAAVRPAKRLMSSISNSWSRLRKTQQSSTYQATTVAKQVLLVSPRKSHASSCVTRQRHACHHPSQISKRGTAAVWCSLVMHGVAMPFVVG